MTKRLLLIGIGLIGGSLALAVKRGAPDVRIIGHDAHLATLAEALRLGVIDEVATDFDAQASQADVIVLAAPVRQTKAMIQHLAQLPLQQTVIITDTSSTKATVEQTAAVLTAQDYTFIGGHPMAGSHKSGVQAAKAILFENALYMLTPANDRAAARIPELQHYLEGTKAHFLISSAQQHDQMVGMISHLPHLIAAGLIQQTAKYTKRLPQTIQLAAGGFRDVTRIAASNPKMWTDIILENRDNLVELLAMWQNEVALIQALVANGNEEAIHAFFAEAKTYREELPNKQRHALHGYSDLLIDIPDYPGVISEVTSVLAAAHISLTNIRVVETREDIMGILQISFQSTQERQRAKQVIEQATSFECSVLE
ncbi:prephenate dehydrogenase [Brochothrix campestris]|uniref:Prephenate dehydrogenase n=1 Tax=Brochothrix campestris FSL F6-1037 TaxID=1265861 RepID=W7CXV9_9LIST|nr:prephenate dehydrogenase [Brochothrix campestris]EUJ41605.1 prephenate dehydrogenase [Brochothrix campestris FSL F6-1037]